MINAKKPDSHEKLSETSSGLDFKSHSLYETRPRHIILRQIMEKLNFPRGDFPDEFRSEPCAIVVFLFFYRFGVYHPQSWKRVENIAQNVARKELQIVLCLYLVNYYKIVKFGARGVSFNLWSMMPQFVYFFFLRSRLFIFSFSCVVLKWVAKLIVYHVEILLSLLRGVSFSLFWCLIYNNK